MHLNTGSLRKSNAIMNAAEWIIHVRNIGGAWTCGSPAACVSLVKLTSSRRRGGKDRDRGCSLVNSHMHGS